MTERLFADPEAGTLDDIVDLDRYPLDRPGNRRLVAVVEQATGELATCGCLRLAAVLRPEALAVASSEIGRIAPAAVFRDEESSVYGAPVAPGEVMGPSRSCDPRNVPLTRRLGHLTRDQIPPDSVIARLYAAPAFKAFVAACTGRQRVFEYADPLAGLVVTILDDGGELAWHYDTNEFVVSIVLQEAEQGGLFQYCPQLRRPGNENLAGLAAVLGDDSSDRIVTRSLRAGDLQIFAGRYSLHRVTRVSGRRQRRVAVLGYADRPGVIGPLDRTRAVYGRVTEAHLVAAEAEQRAPDGLIL